MNILVIMILSKYGVLSMRHVAFACLTACLSTLIAATADDPQVVPRPASAKWTEIKADADGRAWIDAGDKAGEWELIDRSGAYLEVIPGAKYPSFAASKPGLYRVIGVADGKLVRVIVQVGDVPVPPGPGPVIPPDAFVAKLQSAFNADLGAAKANDLKQLIALYAEAVAFADKADFATASDLFAAVSAAAVALLPPDANGQRKLSGVRTLIAADLASVLPSDPDAPLTDAVRKAAAAAFAKYAAALARVVP